MNKCTDNQTEAEEAFARNLCHLLDEGAQDLHPDLQARLRAGRFNALQRQGLLLANAGHGGAIGEEAHPWRSLLVIVFLLVSLSVAFYWNNLQQAHSNADIDSALLVGELPPNAYLDPGFRLWLSHYAQSAPRSAR